jgi:hypothetical protein
MPVSCLERNLAEVQPASFSLVKWYLDFVTDAGDAIILYCADIQWRGLHATVGNLLESLNGAATRNRFSMGRYRLSSTPDEILVEHPRLKFSGRWQAAAPAFQCPVYDSPEGSVQWSCLQPGSHVTARIGSREFIGLGYAECLTLTVPPWRLPMHQLRWGRFVSAESSLAWIDWQGPYSTSFAVLNGRRIALDSATENSIATSDANLQIEPGVSLRSGRLGETILPAARSLGRFFPRNLFDVQEDKWKSRGTLAVKEDKSKHESERTSSGWVIHEIVQWREAVDWKP